jgi:hypothetical protein
MYKTFSNNPESKRNWLIPKPGWPWTAILWSRVNQTWEPHLKIYIDDKKENMVIDDDEIYQIIVAKIIQKRICSRLFLPSATGKMD